MTTTLRAGERRRPGGRPADGFSLVELLIVVVILGVLATVAVFAVRGVTDKGQSSACTTEQREIAIAVEAYLAQYGGGLIAHTTVLAAQQTTVAPFGPYSALAAPRPADATWAIGTTPAETLANAGFLRSAPTLYVVRDSGQLVYTHTGSGTMCIPAGSLSGDFAL